jgi:hypothetical protein
LTQSTDDEFLIGADQAERPSNGAEDRDQQGPEDR